MKHIVLTKTFKTTLDLDTDTREVTPPPDFLKALKAAAAWRRWRELETAVRAIRARPARTR